MLGQPKMRAGDVRRSFTVGGVGLLALSAALTSNGCSGEFHSCAETSACLSSGSSGSAGREGSAGVVPGGGSGGESQAGQNGTSGSSPATGGGPVAGRGGETGGAGDDALGDAGDAGAGGSEGHVCDPMLSPLDEACLVSSEHAVFVALMGSDAAAGTREAPLASITKASKIAAESGKIVLVCNAIYDEHVSIDVAARIYGGFKCTDWSRETEKPLIRPLTTGAALKIESAGDVLLENLSFEVRDAFGSDSNALTAIVNASPSVTLRSVWLKAGRGKPGVSGTLTEFQYPDASSLDGSSATSARAGGVETRCSCQPGFETWGGAGGKAASAGQIGERGGPELGGGAPGEVGTKCGFGAEGGNGSDSLAAAGGVGAATLGHASPSGWTPASGTAGAVGSPGQGGGGGASLNSSGHGGGGGCGGCGGNGGIGGGGGGASIAVLVFSSIVELDACSITVSDAGNGGNGAPGQQGQQTAGVGGVTPTTQNSCAGGSGGRGGAGGGGGGGAGGISVGIAWDGAAPPKVSNDTAFSIGFPGAKGIGGAPAGLDGVAGVAQKIFALNQ